MMFYCSSCCIGDRNEHSRRDKTECAQNEWTNKSKIADNGVSTCCSMQPPKGEYNHLAGLNKILRKNFIPPDVTRFYTENHSCIFIPK